jgi:hypothetical protein
LEEFLLLFKGFFVFLGLVNGILSLSGIFIGLEFGLFGSLVGYFGLFICFLGFFYLFSSLLGIFCLLGFELSLFCIGLFF